MARRGFLSLEIDHRIIAAFLLSLAAGGWHFVSDSRAADAKHDQQQADFARRLEAVERELRDLRRVNP